MADDKPSVLKDVREPGLVLRATQEATMFDGSGASITPGGLKIRAPSTAARAGVLDPHKEFTATAGMFGVLDESKLPRADKIGLLQRLRAEHRGPLDTARFPDPASDDEGNAVAVREFAEWVRAALAQGGFRFEKAAGSQFDSLIDAFANHRVFSCFTTARPMDFHLSERDVFAALACPSFVMEHSWARAFDGAKDFDGGEWRLPFEDTFFEFQLSGRRVICMAIAESAGTFVRPVVRLKCGWCPLPRFDVTDGVNFTISGLHASLLNDVDVTLRSALEQMMREIRAVSIMLEAKVATTEVVRAPEKLNRARAKEGKLPKNDYHVVSLARRHRRPEPREKVGDGEGQGRRLHFRRGHWRHYDEQDSANGLVTCAHEWHGTDRTNRQYCGKSCGAYRRWIEWMLVGDPDLGFVDKHYRL